MLVMGLIVGAVILILILFLIVSMYLLLGKDSDNSKYSKYILDEFEPENTAPKITELVEYHKSKENIKYIIESDGHYERNE